MSDPPAGWYPDPQQSHFQRYWDGSEWTERVRGQPLIDVMLSVGGFIRRKERRLIVTSEELSWGEEQVRWDDVTDFGQLVTTQQYRGVVLYEIHLVCGDRVVHIVFSPRRRRDPATKQAYDTIIEQLGQTLAPRVLNHLLRMAAAGERVRVAGLVLSPEGFAQEGSQAGTIPWSDYAGVQVGGNNGIVVDLFRVQTVGEPKRACRVEVNLLRGWVLPPLVEDYARRYAVQ